MEWVEIIGNYGFSIAMCCAMAWYVKYITDKHREELNNMNQLHKQEMGDITTAVNNNTLAIQRLVDLLNRKDKEDNAQGN